MAPRELPILLGIFVTLTTVSVHTVAVRLDRASPRPDTPRVLTLEAHARDVSAADALLGASVALLAVAAVATQLRAARRRGSAKASEAVAPSPAMRGVTVPTRRAVLVMSMWTCLFVPGLMYMLRRPPAEAPLFLGPCALLLLPVRVYLRHGAGEAEWVPWLVGGAALALLVTGDPRSVAGPLILAMICYGCALRDERRRRG